MGKLNQRSHGLKTSHQNDQMLDSHQLGLVVVVVTVVGMVVVVADVVSGLGFSNRKFLQVGKSSGKYENGRFSMSSSTCNRSIIPSQLLKRFKYF